MSPSASHDQQVLDLGWAEEGSSSRTLRCHVRVVTPLADSCALCCPFWGTLQDTFLWRLARVSVAIAREPLDELDAASVGAASISETLLVCETEDGSDMLRLPLSKLSGLRRLRLPRTQRSLAQLTPPGIEIRLLDSSARLQLLALVPGGAGGRVSALALDEAIARFQLLHAFIAAVAESFSDALVAAAQAEGAEPPALPFISPIEWPCEEGRRASLSRLAAVLRGVEVMSLAEVQSRAAFAGSGCPVCLEAWEEFPPERPVATLACGHAFCEECLGKTVALGSAACPSCRREFGARRPAAGTLDPDC